MRPPKHYRVGDIIVTIKEAADLLDMKEDTLRKRLRRGSTLEIELDVKNSHNTGDTNEDNITKS